MIWHAGWTLFSQTVVAEVPLIVRVDAYAHLARWSYVWAPACCSDTKARVVGGVVSCLCAIEVIFSLKWLPADALEFDQKQSQIVFNSMQWELVQNFDFAMSSHIISYLFSLTPIWGVIILWLCKRRRSAEQATLPLWFWNGITGSVLRCWNRKTYWTSNSRISEPETWNVSAIWGVLVCFKLACSSTILRWCLHLAGIKANFPQLDDLVHVISAGLQVIGLWVCQKCLPLVNVQHLKTGAYSHGDFGCQRHDQRLTFAVGGSTCHFVARGHY